MPAHWAPAKSLAERVVLVTGASGGLGNATALACADAGATLVLCGRKVRPLEKIYDDIVARGGAQPAIFPIDLAGATPADYEQLADAIDKEFGRLDGIVHAAAHFDGLTPVTMQEHETWLRDLHVNVSAPLWLTRACMPLLQAARDSAIVFVLDDPQRTARAHWGGYGVSKAALQQLASILHDENDSGPLRVHGLLPAPMRTALRRMAWFGEDTMAIPTPAAAALAVVYLLSAEGIAARGAVLDLRDPTIKTRE
ncbi:MAG: SDR family NAD(P)-dependent oxidoreductase [Xanthomonadales bacterium]|nr:SDR family NAD(P)-dependent oxidoreductase [Xanthomonadales bacterium]